MRTVIIVSVQRERGVGIQVCGQSYYYRGTKGEVWECRYIDSHIIVGVQRERGVGT